MANKMRQSEATPPGNMLIQGGQYVGGRRPSEAAVKLGVHDEVERVYLARDALIANDLAIRASLQMLPPAQFEEAKKLGFIQTRFRFAQTLRVRSNFEL